MSDPRQNFFTPGSRSLTMLVKNVVHQSGVLLAESPQNPDSNQLKQ